MNVLMIFQRIIYMNIMANVFQVVQMGFIKMIIILLNANVNMKNV